MNTAEDFIILQGHVYQHNKNKFLTIGFSKRAKLKNSRYFMNTPRIFTLVPRWVTNYVVAYYGFR